MSNGALGFSITNPFNSNTYTISLNTTSASSAPVSIPAGNRIGCATFRPTQISNCALWFDAADTSTITGTSTVTGWANKGSISVTAVNRTGSCSSGNRLANGLNYINCPVGTDMGFTCSLNTQARTWFVVARNLTQLTNSPQNYWGPINQTVGGGQDSMVMIYDGTNYSVNIGPSGIDVTITGATSTNFLNVLNIYTVVNSASTTNDNIATLTGNTMNLTRSVLASNFNTNSIQYVINTGPYNTGSDMFEIIFYTRAITPSERQQVEGYLAWKWGVQASLPANHPYKLFPPLP